MKKLLDHWPAKILALSGAIFLFFTHRIDTLLTKSMVLPLRLVKDPSMLPAVAFDPRVRVSIRGPAEIVSTLQDNELEAIANFAKIHIEGTYKSPIKINFRGLAQDSDRLEIMVDPSEFTILLEKKMTKSLVIQPDILPPAKKDYKLGTIDLIPSIMTVEGPRSQLEKMTSIKTELIDLRNKTDSFTMNIKVRGTSSLLSFPNGSNIVVQGEIKSFLATLIIEKRTTQIESLAPGLVLKTALAPVRIRLRAREELLKSLSLDQVHLSLDLSEYTRPEEIPKVPYKVEVPPEIEVIEVSPSSITVVLEGEASL